MTVWHLLLVGMILFWVRTSCRCWNAREEYANAHKLKIEKLKKKKEADAKKAADKQEWNHFFILGDNQKQSN